MSKLVRHAFAALIAAAILWTPQLASAEIHPVDTARRIARNARDTAHRVTHRRHHRHYRHYRHYRHHRHHQS